MSRKETTIQIQVGLDENQIPEKITWSAPDGGVESQDSKAMFLSMWDADQQETLRMDLWVKDMPVDQMQVFFHQVLTGMKESYYRATNDDKMAGSFQDFCDYFSEKLELKKVRKS
ncbi:MAG: gliding motility protein GldC [Flavobacteriaceae bacterium]|nr:gliding motility protein GldC [Flavobacteriaceae bacterium]MDG2314106.1 gliding motility protein GldC [Flavobacteriaceae bacterium]